ncbi:IclR family transcriptional regulator [Streptomyces sp. NPDC055134]
MHNEPLERPPYPVDAADRALRLIHLLRDLGGIRLKDAAAELDVAPSTAHRLFAVLIYRGFAVQDESRRYLPGPALGAGPAELTWSRQLRTVVQPHLEMLAAQLNETANLMIRVGTMVRFIGCVESPNLLRVGDRRGAVLPARTTSGGKAMLAELEPRRLEQLYQGTNTAIGGEHLTFEELAAFKSELAAVRRNGYAVNLESTEEGISAVGAALHRGDGKAVAAVSVAVPSSRYRRVEGTLIPALRSAQLAIDTEIQATLTDIT